MTDNIPVTIDGKKVGIANRIDDILVIRIDKEIQEQIFGKFITDFSIYPNYLAPQEKTDD